MNNNNNNNINLKKKVTLTFAMGPEYTTTLETLTREKGSYFDRLLVPGTDLSNKIFVDRDGELFQYILRYLWDLDRSVFPKDLQRDIKRELKFYKINVLTWFDETKQKICTVPDTISKQYSRSKKAAFNMFDCIYTWLCLVLSKVAKAIGSFINFVGFLLLETIKGILLLALFLMTSFLSINSTLGNRRQNLASGFVFFKDITFFLKH
ncbi:hypothetical protein DFA_07362 [Cavenderia fasciculata]|uniref:Potassium channel tetramerisation-type BTB domain-containing protein n=1 Tax=Cavenderia fasciculata TaxID=261658 RepID=F4PW75_CACFS|nr:uncharacterized protein DFA_07362 [Cavenderia fasciculata]EGG20239.1 hypothetical protein DFA_07362 [Cavenderia fasciculata]|eukprot:XP_004367222.1 hypothetical protein DFA_07362 [Cavenderia fasciculata]